MSFFKNIETEQIALIIAFCSIVITFFIALRTSKPLIAAVLSVTGNNSRYIFIKNYGLGPAIITKIKFEHVNDKTNSGNIFEYLDVPKEECDDFWIFTQDKYYLSPQEKLYPILFTKEQLDKVNKGTFDKYAIKFEEGLDNLKLVIQYKSLFIFKKTYSRYLFDQRK